MITTRESSLYTEFYYRTRLIMIRYNFSELNIENLNAFREGVQVEENRNISVDEFLRCVMKFYRGLVLFNWRVNVEDE